MVYQAVPIRGPMADSARLLFAGTGLADYGHFIGKFRRLDGVFPSQYRQL